MDIPICQICKNPIWSFICPDCLSRDISRWLPRTLRGAFGEFNRTFLRSFSSTIDLDGLRCLHCKEVKVANICPFCYVAEAYDWLRERNGKLAETLLRMLPLTKGWTLGSNGECSLDSNGGCAWSGGLVPVTESELEQRDEGVCESCERYSDNLAHINGRWICRECESLER